MKQRGFALLGVLVALSLMAAAMVASTQRAGYAERKLQIEAVNTRLEYLFSALDSYYAAYCYQAATGAPPVVNLAALQLEGLATDNNLTTNPYTGATMQATVVWGSPTMLSVSTAFSPDFVGFATNNFQPTSVVGSTLTFSRIPSLLSAQSDDETRTFLNMYAPGCQ